VRVQPVLALVGLIGRLEPATAAGMASRLLGLQRDSGLTETDLFEIRSDVPLSRFRIGGAADLAPAGLLAAAQAVRRAVDGSTADDALRALVAEAVGVAIPLLRSARHAGWAAEAVRAVAAAHVGQEGAALLLATPTTTTSSVGSVRATVPPASGLLRVLSTDGSAAVRRAAASRANELDGATAHTLRADPVRSVRTVLAAALGTRE